MFTDFGIMKLSMKSVMNSLFLFADSEALILFGAFLKQPKTIKSCKLCKRHSVCFKAKSFLSHSCFMSSRNKTSHRFQSKEFRQDRQVHLFNTFDFFLAVFFSAVVFVVFSNGILNLLKK